MEDPVVYNTKLTDESLGHLKRIHEINEEVLSLEARVKDLRTEIKGLNKDKKKLEEVVFKQIGIIPEGLNLFTSIATLEIKTSNSQFKD